MAGPRTLSTVFAQPQTSESTTTLLVLLLLLGVGLFAWLLLRADGKRSRLEAAVRPWESILRLLARSEQVEPLSSAIQEALATAMPVHEIVVGWVEGEAIHPFIHLLGGNPVANEPYRLPSPDLPFAPGRLTRESLIAIPDAAQATTLIVTMKVEDQPPAVLVLRRRRSVFNPAEQAAARLLGQALAARLVRRQLQSEIEDRVTQLVLLGEISRRLITLRPLEQRWSEIAPLLSQAFGFARVEVYEGEQDELSRTASHQTQGEQGPSDPPVIVVQALANRTVVLSPESPTGTAHGGALDLAVPLMVEQRTLGVLHLSRDDGPPFTTEEVGLAEMLAGQLAIAALEARNYAYQQEYTWYNTVLLEITRHAAQPGDPESALYAVLQLTTMLAGANWTLLLMPSEDSQSLRVGPHSGLPRDVSDRVSALSLSIQDFDLTAPYEDSDEPLPIELPPPLAEPLQDDRCLGLLLSDGFQVLGLLLVGGPEPTGPQRALLAGIGHQISLRIENIRLIDDLTARRSLERELETARSIQRSFLPDTFPLHPGWQVGATWLAARQVGGDFFDFIQLEESQDGPRWGVVIADVADKGVPAALFMALCRTLLRSIALAHDDPAEVLTRLNELILADTRADLFVSLFYGIWQPGADKITFANGGHNPPVIVEPGGGWRSVERHGMVLGVSPRATYRTHEIELPGDALFVLYTDGVTEAMNPQGEYFGMGHLTDLIASDAGRSAQEVAVAINDAVLSFCGSADPPDDLTTVVIKHSQLRKPDQPTQGE